MLGVLDILIFRGLFCWYDYILGYPYPCDDDVLYDDKKREREKKDEKQRGREGGGGTLQPSPQSLSMTGERARCGRGMVYGWGMVLLCHKGLLSVCLPDAVYERMWALPGSVPGRAKARLCTQYSTRISSRNPVGSCVSCPENIELDGRQPARRCTRRRARAAFSATSWRHSGVARKNQTE